MNRFLSKQIAKATNSSGDIDVFRLCELVSGAYEEMDNDRWRTDRAVSLMAEEHHQLNEELEHAVSDLKVQNLWFEAALENISQALCLFDGEQRLLVCNDRYATMYGLSRELLKPGVTLREILEYRIANGFYAGANPEDYIQQIIDWADCGVRSQKTLELSDGRVIEVTHEPMSGGGWLTTHEDITVRKKAETLNLRLARIVEDSVNEIYVFDTETLKFLQVNVSACKNLGYSLEEMYDLTPLDLKPEYTPEAFEDVIAPLKRGEKDYIRFETVHRRKDGSHYDVEVILQQIRSENRPVFAAIIEDITERKKTETLNLRLARIVEDSINEIYVFDSQTLKFLQVNASACKNLGYTIEELYGLTPVDLKPDYTREAFEDIIAPLKRGEEDYIRFETVHRRKDGSHYDVEIILQQIRSENRPVFAAIIEDITERKLAEAEKNRAEARIRHMAHHDTLTGLPNRVLFNDRLEQAVIRTRAAGEMVSVLCLDLDHFKEVNDTLGHARGDQLLTQVASRIKSCISETDTFSRIGGDEFAILQSDITEPGDAATLAQNIVDASSEPYFLDDHEIFVGTSIGIAVCGQSDCDIEPDDLLRNADLALCNTKAEARGTYIFYKEEIDNQLKARKVLESDIRRALKQGQFEVHYQPQVNAIDNSIAGAEALLRWNHPTRGPISPAEFIPLAEETGLIFAISDFVLRSACRDAAAWARIKLAVNLSPVQFRRPGVAELVSNVLRETGFPPERLELEITEGALLLDTDATIAALTELKSLGVSIAMDDFGTGYSSLGYLRRFPFDKLKIDRNFIKDLGQSTEANAIVQAVISLAKSLGMRANAEGVESFLQADILRIEGCDELQGFFFGKPMPATEFEALLQSGLPLRPAISADKDLAASEKISCPSIASSA
ncbi:putative signaling protein [bacterium MnTg02]|nr:putative signaling protein [bacterium MnTg02]